MTQHCSTVPVGNLEELSPPFHVYSQESIIAAGRVAGKSLNAFLAGLSIRPSWFCVVCELVIHERFSPPAELARFIHHQSEAVGYVFGSKEIQVECTGISQWQECIGDMERSGLVVVASERVEQFFSGAYSRTDLKFAPLYGPRSGDVLLTKAGYSVWDQYCKSCRDYSNVRRVHLGKHCEWMCVFANPEAEQCPLEHNRAAPYSCQKEAGEFGAKLCPIETIGPYWCDNYAICDTGYVRRCFRSLQESEQLHATCRI